MVWELGSFGTKSSQPYNGGHASCFPLHTVPIKFKVLCEWICWQGPQVHLNPRVRENLEITVFSFSVIQELLPKEIGNAS